MSRLAGFVGPSNVALARSLDVERTINRVPCLADAGTPKVRGWLESAPGYAPLAGLSAGPVRALFAQDFGSGDRCFAVGGGVLNEIFPNHTAIARGTVALDGNPATIHTNGTAGYQLLIVSGGLGYIFDLTTNTLTQITDDGFPTICSRGEFCGGFFLALQAHNNVWAFSDPENGLVWPGLSFVQVSESTNDIRAILVNHNEVWNLGQKTTEIWVLDASSSVFGPIGGTFIETGIWAPWSAAQIDGTVFWMGGDSRGAGVIYRAQGYNPTIISTRAVDRAIQTLSSYDNAIAWTYQQDGHSFYVLYLPSSETTWVYDVSTGLWHERGLWDSDLIRYTPDVGRCHCFAFGQHLVGDRTTSTVYRMSNDLYDYELVLT